MPQAEHLSMLQRTQASERDRVVDFGLELEPQYTRDELLRHYGTKPPSRFSQIDCWKDMETDSFFAADDEGDQVLGGATTELMTGADVRVLIREGLPVADARRLLIKALSML